MNKLCEKASSSSNELAFFLEKKVLIFILIILGVVLYIPGLRGPALLDDYHNLIPLLEIQNKNITWIDVVSENESGPLGRPVSMASFLLNYVVWGDNKFFFKLVNVFIHLLIACLIFWLSVILYDKTEIANKSKQAAFCVALLWLINPLFFSTTLYVIQRMAQISCLFMLCSMIAYYYARVSLVVYKSILLYFLSFIFFYPLAIFSKENGLLTLPVLFLLEVFFFKFSEKLYFSNILKKIYFLTFVGGVAFGVYFIFFVGLNYLPGLNYEEREFTLYERVLTQLRVLFIYIKNIFIPDVVSMGVFHDDFLKSSSILKPWTTVMSLFLWVATIFLVIKFWNKVGVRLLSFGILFFLIGHGVESSFLGLELYFEHRNYFPAIGLIWGVVGLGVYYFKKKVNKLIKSGIVLYFVTIYLTAYQLSHIWGDKFTLLQHFKNGHPNSIRVLMDLGSEYSNLGMLSEAINTVNKIKKINSKMIIGANLHQMHILCLNNQIIDEKYYMTFISEKREQNLKYVTIALEKLVYFYRSGHCRSIDIKKLSNYFYTWVVNYKYKRKWLIENIAAELFIVANNDALAMKILKDLWENDRNHVRVGIDLVYLFIKNRQINQAKKVMNILYEYRYDRRVSSEIKYYSRMIKEYE
ncbi:hypothetical protein [Spartinivicinus poritis]|uniref:Uncharacterized protein n=1 Tax=Spartinivicinus poritis TaxID=2994640 RepID=A0ABT5UBA4_9GAMM|nr:hypothetical protein [Spartinivicinus sp. A2-2]MDE1462807.1 hypothetical protein [Spartinivicinus sp. A2-2]